MSEPSSSSLTQREWTRLELAPDRHYGLPAFPFTRAATFEAETSRFGVRIAVPSQMVLAHLLEHRAFKADIIESTRVLSTPHLRRNKDLGRAIAIAVLAAESGYGGWAQRWERTLIECFPADAPELRKTAGAGLRQLLDSSTDLLQAHEIAVAGLLANTGIPFHAFREAGKTLLFGVVDTL